MRVQLSVSRSEEGAVAVMTAILAVILIGVAAFTTDFGMIYAQRQAMATGADSAALAVVHAKYLIELATPTLCTDLISQDAGLPASAQASTIALAQINANAPFGATLLASDVTTTMSCATGTMQVAVVVNRTINPILGGVLRASPTPVSRQAVAGLGVANAVTGLEPLALCTNQAQDIINAHDLAAAAGHQDSAQLVSITKVWGTGSQCDGGGGSGNWGWLDFGQGKGNSALGGEITSGDTYGPLTLNTSTTPASYTITGTPGNKGNGAPVVAGMASIMDKSVTLPVYSTVTGNGANATYTVIGFLSVQLCGYEANKKSALGTCYDSVTPGVQVSGDDLQVRFVSYTPAGQIGTGPGACGIGQTCAYNAYITELLK